ncbi:MAG: PQQ-dependent sugar dehydrogenase [Bacteroidota bacterium]
MRNLEIPLSELYSYINDAEKRSEDISSVNVGWHIEHSLLVIQKISESVIKSDQNKYKWKFSLPRLASQKLHRCVVNGDQILREEIILKDSGRVRNVIQGPDESLYVSVEGPGRIIKISPR